MSNRTFVTEFLLLGFSDIRELQILHFVGFLVIYLAVLVGNLLIFVVIAFDHHLHTPMYFFLMNLSVLDLGSISVTVPKSMANSLMNIRSISYTGCIAQVFLVSFFVSGDFALLTIMAYDRYIAICKPLHYEAIMNKRACVQMAASAWISVILYSAIHTTNTFAISFCGGNMVDQFFCEIPALLKLACADSYLPEVGFLAFSVCLALNCFVFIIISYVQIFTRVLRIPSVQGQHKAFSTCLPHLTVLSLLCSTGFFTYLNKLVCFALTWAVAGSSFILTFSSYGCILRTAWHMPSESGLQKALSTCGAHIAVTSMFYGSALSMYARPPGMESSNMDKVVSLFYCVLTPLLNPIIYTLRNDKVKEALRKAMMNSGFFRV
uniref:Olfactory receptor n=1 Tax=Pelusios castaneus TaxID=367368 RepID=A0A8C8VH16_9SAUR